MKDKATRNPRPVIGWTKKRIQDTLIAWPEEVVGDGKSQMIGYRTSSAKMIPFRQRKFGKESLVWEQKSVWKNMLIYSQTPGGPLARKENLWTEDSRKHIQPDSGDATRP